VHPEEQNEEELLRTVALRNANAILLARLRAEEELVAAKEALRETSERLSAVFNQAAVGMATADLDGRFRELNEKFCEILGYSCDELQHKNFVEITHPEDIASTKALVGKLVDGAVRDYIVEKRYVRKDGETVWSLTSVTLMRDAAGHPQRFIGVIEDITQRKRAEEALREETRVLEILNETGVKLAANLDLQTLVQAVTDAATELTGAQFGSFFYNTIDEDSGEAFMLYTLSGAPREAFEKFGKPRATALFGPTFRGEGVTRINDVLTDARYGRMAPHHGMPKGHLPVRSYLAAPVISRSREVIGGLFFGHSEPAVFNERAERLLVGIAAQAAIAIDNARLFEAAQKAAEDRRKLLESERAARAQSERANAMKDDFLATLSHELRTPLNAILGWAQVLRRGVRNPADLQQGLETIERNARAQTGLIEDLLDMSRIISGKLRLDIQTLEPVPFIDAAIETVRPAAEAKGVRLEKILDARAGPVLGDTGRLQQVVWNLVSNAVKFTPKGGKVQVILQRVSSHVEISVTDTGMGIRPEFLAHVFERFRQADPSSTRTFGGLGLGLSIVKDLIELHGGSVHVTSRGEGLGATFSVHLPLAVLNAAPPPVERVHPRAPSARVAVFEHADLSGVRVLVVDDEVDARELIARILRDCDANVATAGGAHEALEILQREGADLLVSDVGMPDIDGYELLRRVRALPNEGTRRIPAVALTAFARSEDRTRALRAGFLVHVAKPVEPSELIATIASVAGRTGAAFAD
jgi:PAS domain S-box-containing protein